MPTPIAPRRRGQGNERWFQEIARFCNFPGLALVTWELQAGDCVELMAAMPEASVDAVVCDPPAGIGFMGRNWDHDKGGRDAWVEWLAEVMREAMRVCKPGAHAFVWALPRTSHWTGYALEEAGWEVRDRIAHHFGSGFPKSHNLPGGLGTALKPATEDWWLCRKPLIGTVAQNVLEHGTGALNIDGCRVGTEQTETLINYNRGGNDGWQRPWNQTGEPLERRRNPPGRWPANVVLSPEAAEELDAQSGELHGAGNVRPSARGESGYAGGWGGDGSTRPLALDNGGGASRFFLTVPADTLCSLCGLPLAESAALYSPPSDPPGATVPEPAPAERAPKSGGKPQSSTDTTSNTTTPPSSSGSALAATPPATPIEGAGNASGLARFRYQSKCSRAERNAGLEGFEDKPVRPSGAKFGEQTMWNGENGDPEWRAKHPNNPAKNHHPTVKPIALMRWLCRLVTPPGGTVLDPFTGSGTTGCAAVLEGFDFIGCEREPEYVAIAEARIAFWAQHVGREVEDVLGLHTASEREAQLHAERGQLTIGDVAA